MGRFQTIVSMFNVAGPLHTFPFSRSFAGSSCISCVSLVTNSKCSLHCSVTAHKASQSNHIHRLKLNETKFPYFLFYIYTKLYIVHQLLTVEVKLMQSAHCDFILYTKITWTEYIYQACHCRKYNGTCNIPASEMCHWWQGIKTTKGQLASYGTTVIKTKHMLPDVLEHTCRQRHTKGLV